MGCRLESLSDAEPSLLALRRDSGRAGAPVAGASELRVDVDPVTALSLCSKRKSASSECFEREGVGEILLSCRESPWWMRCPAGAGGGSWC